MVKEILKVVVKEENGEYHIDITGENAGEIFKRFSSGCFCGCMPSGVTGAGKAEEGRC